MASRSKDTRNLTLRGGVWYFQQGKYPNRVRISLETSDLREAQALRDDLLAEIKNPAPPPSPGSEITFAEFSQRYLRENAKRYLRKATYDDHARFLRVAKPGTTGGDGLLIRAFGQPGWSREPCGR